MAEILRVTGVVERKVVNDDNGRVSFKIKGGWYSYWPRTEHEPSIIEALADLRPGDEVTLGYYKSAGKDGRLYNNVDVAGEGGHPVSNVTKGDGAYHAPEGSTYGGRPYGGKPAARVSRWTPEDKRPSVVSFAQSYAKDIVVSIIESNESLKAMDPDAVADWAKSRIPQVAQVILKQILSDLEVLEFKFTSQADKD